MPLGELVGDGRRVRLIGVRAEHLRPAGGAPLWDPDEDWRDAERTVDEVVRKFGRGAVRPAALVRPGAPGPLPTAGTGWGARRARGGRRLAQREPSGRMARRRPGTRLSLTRRAALIRQGPFGRPPHG